MTHTGRLQVPTRGDTHVIDISGDVARIVRASGARDGLVCVFVVGSTAAITTTEAEPGLLTHDLKAFWDRVAPAGLGYKHEATWHDDNGHSHVRASALGPSIAVPLVEGKLTVGQWQQIVLIDFDTRPREREVIVQVLGS